VKHPLRAKAMAVLAKAGGMGHCNADQFHVEDILDPLRGREDLPLLLLGIAYPTSPFAKPQKARCGQTFTADKSPG